MKEWRTEEEETAEQAARDSWWQRLGEALDPEVRDNVIVGATILIYTALLCWPLYGLAVGAGMPASNLTLLGGTIGLLLATYAVMSDRLHGWARRTIGAVGIAIVVLCFGFGPL
jgi:hypothetical protein